MLIPSKKDIRSPAVSMRRDLKKLVMYVVWEPIGLVTYYTVNVTSTDQIELEKEGKRDQDC